MPDINMPDIIMPDIIMPEMLCVITKVKNKKNTLSFFAKILPSLNLKLRLLSTF